MAFGSTLNQKVDTGDFVTQEELNDRGYSGWKLMYHVDTPNKMIIDFAYTFDELPGAFKAVYDIIPSMGYSYNIRLSLTGGPEVEIFTNTSTNVSTRVTNVLPVARIYNDGNNKFVLETTYRTGDTVNYFIINLNTLSTGTLKISHPERVKNFNLYYLSSL